MGGGGEGDDSADRAGGSRGGQASQGAVILILDQFEDYLLQPAPVGTKECFDDWLATIVNRNDIEANVLLGVREDYLAKVNRLRARIPGLLANALRLDPLSAIQARLAVTGPLDRYNRAAELQNRPEMRVTLAPDDHLNAVLEGTKAKEARVNTKDEYQPAALQIAMERLWMAEAARWERGEPRELRASVLGKDLAASPGSARLFD